MREAGHHSYFRLEWAAGEHRTGRSERLAGRRPRRDTKGASTANQAAVTAMPSTASGLSILPRLATSRIRASGFPVEQPLDSRQQ
jgi:hypothetical protein